MFFAPAVVPWIATEITQLPLPLNPPFVRLTVPEPAFAVAVPPQVLLRFGGDATCRPDGKVSVKAIADRDVVFGLEMFNVSVVTPPSGTVGPLNEVVIVGGPTTVKVTEPVFPVPPLSDETAKLIEY